MTTNTLELPPSLYQELKETASASNIDPTTLIARLLKQFRAGTNLESPPAKAAPIMRWAGAFSSDSHNLAADHDFHIGVEALDPHE